MQLNPRLLVNLLVKLTKNEYPNGGHGGGSPLPVPVARVRGIHSGEARTSDQHQIVQQWPWASAAVLQWLDYWQYW